MKRNSIKRPIYIGDTHWDQEAAFTAGAKFIFARFGFGSIQVSSPSVENFNELVSIMTAPTGEPRIEIRKLSSSEFLVAESFYKSVGYVQTIQPQDKFFAAFDEREMVGLVRLAFENGHWVLRGMQIKSKYQFFGIGTKLIRLLEIELGNDSCFCLPHGWLDRFYGQTGFKTMSSMLDVPSFLADRLTENKKKHPQLILMRRSER